jgi:hypothetical protein
LSLHAYDVATDTWSVVGPTGLAFELNDSGLAYDPAQDVLYAIAGDGNLYRLDPNTGTATRIGPTGLAPGIGGGPGFIPDRSRRGVPFAAGREGTTGGRGEMGAAAPCGGTCYAPSGRPEREQGPV